MMLRKEIGRSGRRAGRGRDARRAARQATGPSPAVRPGMAGGRYRPLGEADILRIHKAALEILASTGIGDPTEELLEVSLPGGCHLNDLGRLCFPASLIEDIIAGAAKEYRVYARGRRTPADDLDVGGERVYYSTGGQAVTLLDAKTRKYRPSVLVDLYDLMRLVDQLDNIHMGGGMHIATDLPDPFEHDINLAYTLVAASEKPFCMSFMRRETIASAIAMFDRVLGGEGRFVERPFCIFGGCPIVSPLRFGEDNLEVLIETSRLGLVSDIAVAPQAGATAPASLAGTLVQVVAETLACLAVVNLVQPGCPMTFAAWPLVSDLRSGAFSGGSGEEALLSAAALQIGNWYGLPTSVGAGMSDAKVPDAQAGYEKGISTVMAGLAGGNRVVESAGMLGSLLGCSFESLVIDNDMLGMAMRAIRGIEVNDETLAVDVIKQVALDPGHYLGHPQTLALMESEYLYPQIGDRNAPGAWEAEGAKTLLETARERVEEMLSQHYPDHLDPATDAALRERFPIRLPAKDMRPGNGRW